MVAKGQVHEINFASPLALSKTSSFPYSFSVASKSYGGGQHVMLRHVIRGHTVKPNRVKPLILGRRSLNG